MTAPGVLYERAAAALLGLSVHTLRNWRRLRRRPRSVKIPGAERAGRGHAGHAIYRELDLLLYLNALTVPSEGPLMPANVFPSPVRRRSAEGGG
jgi:hypothetical protein